MNWLITLLRNDKTQHFVYGLALAGVLQPFGFLVSFLGVLAVALLKEYVDSRGYGIPDKYDVVATIAGPVFLEEWYELIGFLISKLQ